MLILSNIFSPSLDKTVYFFLIDPINAVNAIDRFLNVEPTAHSRDKFQMVMRFYLLLDYSFLWTPVL